MTILKSGLFLMTLIFGAVTWAQAPAGDLEKIEGMDCSQLTPEQMGDKNACWAVKKADMGRTRSDTESTVEFVSELPRGASLVNVAQPELTSETNLNIYSVPQFKNAVSTPSIMAPSSDSGDKRPGNQ